MALTRGETWRLAARSLLLQVLLNLRTMQGPGYLFVLWPWLRKADHRASRVRAAAGYLNSHPVTASLAIGALQRRLADGIAESNPDDLAQWQSMISGPLGMVGDSLIWDRWKPLIFAVAALLVLWFPRVEVWTLIAAGSLAIYNVPLWFVRLWGVRTGDALGERTLDALGHPVIGRIRNILTMAGASISGLLLASFLIQTGRTSGLYAGQFVTALAISYVTIKWQWKILWTALTALTAAMGLPWLLRGLSLL